jgi:pimeloyl-ACP methyl ester carboxylesterase
MQIPETKYAKSGDLHIAYAADGEGPPDLLCCYWTSHVGAAWDWAPSARLHRRLRTFGRVILFDLPGQGLSDPVSLATSRTSETCRRWWPRRVLCGGVVRRSRENCG